MEVEGRVSYARQLATYPILVGIVGNYPRNSFVDARVIDYGHRSVTALEAELDVNKATLEQLEYLLGKLGRDVYLRKPFSNEAELEAIAGSEALLYLRVGKD